MYPFEGVLKQLYWMQFIKKPSRKKSDYMTAIPTMYIRERAHSQNYHIKHTTREIFSFLLKEILFTGN